MNKKTPSVSYEDAGVSVERGNLLVERIKNSAQQTTRQGVMSGLGGFGALFDLSQLEYREPVLVSGTDGVGTKIKLAIDSQRHDTIGIDLVAMCVNDLLVQGAEPLFFLDYFACSKLDVDIAAKVVAGIAKGCETAKCALVGGETAEMPGMYQTGDYDLAGFCVGVVEKSEIIDGNGIADGDAIIALASSGPHSNGYSLIRKIIDDGEIPLDTEIAQRPLIDHLMQPTRIYVESVLTVAKQFDLKGLAHITGGGLIENIPRVLPDKMAANIRREALQLPPIFQWLQSQGNIIDQEMFRTFNCGVGMVLIVDSEIESQLLESLNASGETAWSIGEIQHTDGSGPSVIFS